MNSTGSKQALPEAVRESSVSVSGFFISCSYNSFSSDGL